MQFSKDICLKDIVEKHLVIEFRLLLFVSCSATGIQQTTTKGGYLKPKITELRSFLIKILYACGQCFQTADK